MEIRQALLGAGWGAMDVEEAFHAAGPGMLPRASMDILEKELSYDTPVKTGFLHRRGKQLFTILILVIILPVLGFGGFWAYERFFGGAGDQTNDTEADATSVIMAEANAAATRDQQRVENIEALQTGLASFYNAKQYYPQTLEQLVVDKFLTDIPTDPSTAESYLYIPLGEPWLDYSLTFILETDFGTLSKGLNEVSPQNLIRAAAIKTEDQSVKGIITKTASSELVITDLSGISFSPGDEANVMIDSAANLNEAFLLVGHLKLHLVAIFGSVLLDRFHSAIPPQTTRLRNTRRCQ